MLDINFIRKNPEIIKKTVLDKRINLDIDALLELDKQYLSIIKKSEALRMQRNKNADILKSVDKNNPDFKIYVEEGKKIKQQIEQEEGGLKSIEEKLKDLLLRVPNIPSVDTPVGADDSQNVEVAKWGEPTTFKFEFKDHIAIGRDLDIIDLEKGVSTSGFRGYYLKGDGALLHLGILMYAFNKIISKGFTPFIPPTLVKDHALLGSGHFPFGKEEIYQIGNPGKLADGETKKEPVYLAGTSEPSLLAYFNDELLEEKDLPKKVCAISQCYRSEIGSYGKDVKGLYRIHEFMKVEQVILCKNDINESNEWLEYLRSIAEEILQELKLPYRVLQICTGDMGAGKYKMYDVETWMPSRNNYGETHSDSNLTDWQARRLGIKYRASNGEIKYVHTLNNTVLASPRILIAVLENFQNSDGTVNVPEVLQSYVGKKIISKI